MLLVGNYESDVGYAWNLIEELWVRIGKNPRLAGTRIHVTFSHVRTVSQRLRDAGFTIHELDFLPSGPRSVWAQLAFLRRHRISAVYLSDWPTWSVRYLLYRLVGVRRIIVHDHTPGYRPEPGPVVGAMRHVLNRLPWLPCDAALAVGPFVARRLVRVNRFPDRRVHLVTNGIVPQDDPAPRPDRDRVTLITASRANRYKGIPFALDVVEELVRRGHRHVRYVLCGDGPHLDEFRDAVVARSLSPWVELPGRVDDMPHRLQEADIAFHPSRGEAMSLAILEYMRAGLPVVVSDNPSVNSALRDGVDALFHHEGDVSGAADVLERLVLDAGLRRRLGAEGRASLVRSYSKEGMLSALDQAVEAALG